MWLTLGRCAHNRRLSGGELAQPSKKGLQELQYLVGTWQYQGRIGDERVEGMWSTRWAPGKHCLIQQSSRSEGHQTVRSAGIIGRDATAERVIERAFRTDNATFIRPKNLRREGATVCCAANY